MSGLSWQIGDVKITQIIELDECEGLQQAISKATPEKLLKIPWLTPNFIDDKGKFKSQICSFMVESDNSCIMVDEEFNYWKKLPSSELKADCEGIKDSVLPVYDAELVDLIPADFSITSEVSLISTPGHTPGHVSILIKSNGKQAVITGDSLHHPCQLAHPEWETIDTDREQANELLRSRAAEYPAESSFLAASSSQQVARYSRSENKSRRALLEQFVDTKTLFIGSHFAPPTAGYLVRDGKGFKLELDNIPHGSAGSP